MCPRIKHLLKTDKTKKVCERKRVRKNKTHTHTQIERTTNRTQNPNELNDKQLASLTHLFEVSTHTYTTIIRIVIHTFMKFYRILLA